MKKILLSIATMTFAVSSFGQLIIEKDDLHFTQDNEWKGMVVNQAYNYLFPVSGTGNVWDFSTLTGNGTEVTTVNSANTTSVLVTSTLKGDFNFKVADTTYTYASLSGVTADNPYSVSLGLPHYYGKFWSGTATGFGGFVSVNMVGEVIATGQIITPLGTEDCLLVKETITGAVSEKRYYWETKNHGRVATFYDNTDELVVTTSFGTSTGPNYGSGWEIAKDDLYWGLGKKVVGEFHGMTLSQFEQAFDVKGGDSLTWDFTALSGGYLDTGMVYYDDGSTIKVQSGSKVDQFFKHNDSTFTILKIDGQSFDNPNSSSVGLPHRYGKQWTADNTIQGGLVQVKIFGEVIGRGKVKVGLGEFDCLLVKEVYTGGFSVTHYYWETKEHGRVAAYFSSYDELTVMRARFNTPQNPSGSGVSISNLSWESGVQKASLVYLLDSLSSVLNLNGGIGQAWDFTTLTGGVLDSIIVAANARIHYDVDNGTGKNQEFYEEGGTYFYEEIEGITLDTPNTVTLGLPYVFGKEWYCAGHGFDGAIYKGFGLTGKVIGEGTIKIDAGTFACVLVHEDLTGDVNADNYYWYTKEHGRVASYIDESNELSVMKLVQSNSALSLNTSAVTLYPNPSQGIVNVNSAPSPVEIIITNQQGSVVRTIVQSNSFDVSGLSAGIYTVSLVFSNEVITQQLVVK